MYTPVNPSFAIGFKGVYIWWICLPDENIDASSDSSGILEKQKYYLR